LAFCSRYTLELDPCTRQPVIVDSLVEEEEDELIDEGD
jgi:hypothetical protein